MNLRESLPQPLDDLPGIIQAQRGLGQICHLARIRDLQIFHLFHGNQNPNRMRGFAKRADHFIVIFMADEDNRVTLASVSNGLHVYLGDQRTRGIDHLQLPLRSRNPDLGRDPMGAENNATAGRDFVEILYEYRSFLPQFIDDILVMDNLTPYV